MATSGNKAVDFYEQITISLGKLIRHFEDQQDQLHDDIDQYRMEVESLRERNKSLREVNTELSEQIYNQELTDDERPGRCVRVSFIREDGHELNTNSYCYVDGASLEWPTHPLKVGERVRVTDDAGSLRRADGIVVMLGKGNFQGTPQKKAVRA